MRRPTKTALALTLAACVALGAQAGAAAAANDDPVVSFTRTDPATTDTVSVTGPDTVSVTARTAASTGRVWYIVGEQQRLPLDANGNGEYDEGDIPELPSSFPSDSVGRLALLQAAGIATDATTLEEAVSQLELPFMFAGREQWVLNLTSPDGAAADPRLWNVSMESPAVEANSLRLLLGRAAWALEERRTMADDVAYWESLVPEWAPRVRDALAARGIPFSVELLSSPDIELYDLAKPLFPKDSAPTSLQQLGVEQAGENAFLRSLGADELMTEVWPYYFRYHHRAAGSALPEDLEPGLTFGNVIAESCDTEGRNGCINGVYYRHSPLKDTFAYQRWLAYGMPGDSLGHNGYVVDDGLGWAYSPVTNKFWKVHEGWGDMFNVQRKMWFEALQNGEIQASYFASIPWQEVVEIFLRSKIAVAGFLGDPSIWFDGPRADFAPDLVGDTVLTRYKTMMG